MKKLLHAEIPRPSLKEIDNIPRLPIVAILDNIRSVANVGSIFRTSDAFLLKKLYLAGITATPEHKSLHKTGLGAQDTVPWEYVEDAASTVRSLRSDGYKIAVLEITDKPRTFSEIDAADYPLCLIVGHEVFGVNDGLIELADFALEIPQFGIKQSLNVAVAYGIALHALATTYLAGSDGPSDPA